MGCKMQDVGYLCLALQWWKRDSEYIFVTLEAYQTSWNFFLFSTFWWTGRDGTGWDVTGGYTWRDKFFLGISFI